MLDSHHQRPQPESGIPDPRLLLRLEVANGATSLQQEAGAIGTTVGILATRNDWGCRHRGCLSLSSGLIQGRSHSVIYGPVAEM